jgi:hypothetical protein
MAISRTTTGGKNRRQTVLNLGSQDTNARPALPAQLLSDFSDLRDEITCLTCGNTGTMNRESNGNRAMFRCAAAIEGSICKAWMTPEQVASAIKSLKANADDEANMDVMEPSSTATATTGRNQDRRLLAEIAEIVEASESKTSAKVLSLNEAIMGQMAQMATITAQMARFETLFAKVAEAMKTMNERLDLTEQAIEDLARPKRTKGTTHENGDPEARKSRGPQAGMVSANQITEQPASSGGTRPVSWATVAEKNRAPIHQGNTEGQWTTVVSKKRARVSGAMVRENLVRQRKSQLEKMTEEQLLSSLIRGVAPRVEMKPIIIKNVIRQELGKVRRMLSALGIEPMWIKEMSFIGSNLELLTLDTHFEQINRILESKRIALGDPIVDGVEELTGSKWDKMSEGDRQKRASDLFKKRMAAMAKTAVRPSVRGYAARVLREYMAERHAVNDMGTGSAPMLTLADMIRPTRLNESERDGEPMVADEDEGPIPEQ